MNAGVLRRATCAGQVRRFTLCMRMHRHTGQAQLLPRIKKVHGVRTEGHTQCKGRTGCKVQTCDAQGDSVCQYAYELLHNVFIPLAMPHGK